MQAHNPVRTRQAEDTRSQKNDIKGVVAGDKQHHNGREKKKGKKEEGEGERNLSCRGWRLG